MRPESVEKINALVVESRKSRIPKEGESSVLLLESRGIIQRREGFCVLRIHREPQRYPNMFGDPVSKTGRLVHVSFPQHPMDFSSSGIDEPSADQGRHGRREGG
jgi:hypothetical protein